LLDLGAESDSTKVVVAIPSASTFNEKLGRDCFAGKDVLLCFDGDKAGETATDRADQVSARTGSHYSGRLIGKDSENLFMAAYKIRYCPERLASLR
jgi:hypothetical protein